MPLKPDDRCHDCGDRATKLVIQRNGYHKPMCMDCMVICPECGAVEGTEAWGTVGDGFDGYCPSCADRREEDGTSGQDRESYSDDQDRESYTVEEEQP